jgi:hypothetical protein
VPKIGDLNKTRINTFETIKSIIATKHMLERTAK